jgi:hypothetical protein
MFYRFANCVVNQRFLQKWSVADPLAKQAGQQTFLYMSNAFWPSRCLPAVSLAKSMANWNVSWKTAAGQVKEAPAEPWTWTREEGEGGRTVSNGTKSAGKSESTVLSTAPNLILVAAVLLNLKATILSRLPGSVEKSEAEGFLPRPGLQDTIHVRQFVYLIALAIYRRSAFFRSSFRYIAVA